MNKMVIIGAGAFAREVFSIVNMLDGGYEVVGFVDPDLSLKGNVIAGRPILGNDEELTHLREQGVSLAFVAIGKASTRESLFSTVADAGIDLVNVVHPAAVVPLQDVSIGKGIIVYPNSTINTGCRIGNGVLVNSNVSLGHDVDVGDFVNINPGANVAGRVKIGKRAFLGIGCNVLENLIIGDDAVVGGGALVRTLVPSKSTVVGVPAKPIPDPKKHKQRVK
jgi:sugar O-acyltransferase (sialic acid O-acetyltransferase NeuD family)